MRATKQEGSTSCARGESDRVPNGSLRQGSPPGFVVATPWDTLDMGTGHRSSVQLQLIGGTGGGRARARPGPSAGTGPSTRRTRTWRLDARTREIGREGVAQAREILSRVTPP